MAFGIKRTALTGVNTKYHKISDIEINVIENKCIITLEDYMTEDYRKKAKEQEEIKNSISKLIEQANNSNKKDISDGLLLKANKLQENNSDLLDKNYIAGRINIVLDYIPEILTLESFYKELAKLEDFKEAENI